MRFQVVDVAARQMPRAFVFAFALGMGVTLFFQSAVLRAESLPQALVSAYQTNPTLNAERAKLRAIDEEIAQARSNYRPSLSADLNTGYRKSSPNLKNKSVASGGGFNSGGTNHPQGYSFTANKTLFRGFRTINAVREARATINAGRADLRTVEQTTLLDAVSAYMDVLRDQAIVRLREGNVRVLSEQLKATKDRFEVGEVTKTDTAQAEARRSGAISQLNLAQSNLKTSRAAYERIIGRPPSNLLEPSPIDGLLPQALQSALYVAKSENPLIESAEFTEEASRFAIKQIRGELLPEVSVEGTYQDTLEPSVTLDRQHVTTLTGRITVPLYSRGEPSSRLRQAVETNRQRIQEIDQARAQAQSDVIAAWGRVMAARAQIESDQAQVRANKIALNGVREEEKVGQRTILDVLDAEQELLDSQVGLVTTQRERVVATFTLLAAVGRLNVQRLRLPVEPYDPVEHFDRIQHRWFGKNPDRRGRLGR